MPKILQAEIATSFIYAISPSAKVENLPNGRILITITDKEGTTTAQIPVISKEGIENIINEYFQEHPIAQKWIQQHNESASAHQDIRQLIQQAIDRIPTKTSQLENNSGFITFSDIPVGPSAQTIVPLMNGVASAGSHFTFARGDHIHPSDDTKVDKVDGKGLSSNDFTTIEKNKLAGIQENATRVIVDTTLAYQGQAADAKKTGEILANKVDIVLGKGLSTNDYTNAEKQKVSQTANGLNEVSEIVSNAIDELHGVENILNAKVDKVNGKGLSTNDYTTVEKNKLAAFGQASIYALKSDITNVYKYKGSVVTISLLPLSDNITGDVYNVEDSGMNYAWDGAEWDALGQIFTITAISNNDIDTIMA